MSVTSKIVTPQSTPQRYPLLRQSKTVPDFIILFTGPSTGTIVSIKTKINEKYVIGYTDTDWDDHSFKDFYGEVVLRNE